MRLRLRLLLTILAALCGRRLGLFDESLLHLRVLFNDVDVRQVSNDRYHALMDLGRIDLIVRLGLLPTFLRNGWTPYTRFVGIRHRHPLGLLQRYVLRSRILGWDAEAFWVRQEFQRGGCTTTLALCKLGVRGRHGRVPTATVLSAYGWRDSSPPRPPIAALLDEAEAQLRAQQAGAP